MGPGPQQGQPYPGQQFSGQQFPGQQFPGQQGNFQPQGQQPGSPPYSGEPNGPPPGTPRGNHAGAWVALAVVVALIIGLGTWMVFFRGSPTVAPVPGETTTVSAEPTEEPTTTEADPTEDPTDEGLDPSPAPEPTGDLSLPVGSIINPLTDCAATATDAIGEMGPDNRLTSGAGLSMPAAEGFVPTPVQYPWVHESNSQVKEYADTNWAAAVTVGTVRADEGFVDAPTAAVSVVACLLGSDFYEGSDPKGSVVNFSVSDGSDVSAISVDVFVQGQPGIVSDYVFVMAAYDAGVMHVVISSAPDSDPAGIDLVGEVVKGVALG